MNIILEQAKKDMAEDGMCDVGALMVEIERLSQRLTDCTTEHEELFNGNCELMLENRTLRQRMIVLEESEKRWIQQSSDFEKLAVIAQQRADREAKILEAQDESQALRNAALRQERRKCEQSIGVTAAMPGTTGFTMAVFEAAKVPVGTKLYASVPTIPHGWRLVPVEFTEEMFRAMTDGFITVNGDARKEFELGYKAMLAASPNPGYNNV